ncbi:MAG TPA: hypothetical protein VNT81_22900 [Vicinamibacterales bacterium]|nr:hypothetical protein [Vicinamibacterales bacterium]
MTFRLTLAVAIVGTLITGCAKGRLGPPPDTEAPAGPRTLKKLSVEERQAVMERAKVWRPIDTASLNIIRGPVLPPSQRIPGQVTCSFVFPEKPLSGMTQKFECDLGKKDVVKVKYGEKNGEVYAEVAASRLLWALGFQADVMYPTRVTCLNCPEDPFATSGVNWQRGSPSNVSTKEFNPAVIEREGGHKVEVPGYEGWAWPELDKLSARGAGATRAHLDAFKLLAVFIQHSDSKPGQQEIVCQEGRKRKDAKGNETCAEAWLVIKDLGGSFGKATKLNTSKMNLADWDEAGIWKDAKQCVGDMPRSFTGSLEDPKISEAGRRFLAQRLARLTDRQIRDLFTVSQVEKRGEQITGADGRKRSVTVDDWVRVFKRKRAEIAAARCRS